MVCFYTGVDNFQKGSTAYRCGNYATALSEWTPLADALNSLTTLRQNGPMRRPTASNLGDRLLELPTRNLSRSRSDLSRLQADP